MTSNGIMCVNQMDMNAKYTLGPKVIYTAILIIDNESKSGRSK